eukprot:5326198-Amphidinium_carterae.1
MVLALPNLSLRGGRCVQLHGRSPHVRVSQGLRVAEVLSKRGVIGMRRSVRVGRCMLCLRPVAFAGLRSLARCLAYGRFCIRVLPRPIRVRVAVDVVLSWPVTGVQGVACHRRVCSRKPESGMQFGCPGLAGSLLVCGLHSIRVLVEEDGMWGATDLYQDGSLRGWLSRPEEPYRCLSK